MKFLFPFYPYHTVHGHLFLITKQDDDFSACDALKILTDHTYKIQDHFLTNKQKIYLTLCEKNEKNRKIDAIKTIQKWWISMCYDLNRPCGQRMMER